MKRKFITNLVLLLILNLLIKPFWIFGIDRKVQNLVGAEEYGLYFSLFSFSMLLNIILDAGITNLNNRSISRNRGILSSYFSRIVPLRFLLALLYALITITAGFIIGYSSVQLKLLFVLIINQFLASFILYLRSNISGLQLLQTDSLISVLDRFLMIIICSFLIWGNIINKEFRIQWFVYAQSLSYLITCLVTLIIVLVETGRIRFSYNKRFTLKILKQSYPYALLVLLMSLFSRTDLVMLERMLSDGKEQAGIYVQSFRILDAVSMFAFLFAGLLLPIFSRMIKQGAKISEMLSLSFTLLIIPAISISIICSQYSAYIIDVLYKEHILFSSGIFSVLIFSSIFISTSYIFGTLLTANGSLKELNILAGVTVIINIVLNISLIPSFKALGPALSSLVSQGFFASGLMLLTVNLFRFTINYNLILKIIVFTFIMYLTGRIIHSQIPVNPTGLILSFILSILYACILRIIVPNDILKIIYTKTFSPREEHEF